MKAPKTLIMMTDFTLTLNPSPKRGEGLESCSPSPLLGEGEKGMRANLCKIIRTIANTKPC